MQNIFKTIAALILIVNLIACGSNPSDSVPNQRIQTKSALTTGIAPATQSANFGQAATAEAVAATAKELGSYFNGKNAINPQALIGATATSANGKTAQPMLAASNVASAIFRFYNTNTGAHFFTMSAAERDYVKNTFPFYTFEGTAFFAYPEADPTLSPVYRFYNHKTGTHFFTISAAEKDFVIATWPTIYSYEGIAWYANTVSSGNLVAVYRFFNTRTGAHFYTTSAGERDYVQATWNWFNYEGIAYYVRPDATPVITVPPAQPQNVKVYISAANTLPAGCNFTYEQCWADSVNNGTVLIINGGGQNYAYYRSNTQSSGLIYNVRALGSDGKPMHGSNWVDDNGVSSPTDWVMGRAADIVKHELASGLCYNASNNPIACPA